jgi:hypothetical protein
MWTFARRLGLAWFVVTGAPACGAADDRGTAEPPSSGGSDGKAGGSGGSPSGGSGWGSGGNGSGSGGLATGCSPSCPPGTFCSASGECIPNGSCKVTDDCSEGFECDPGSSTCTPGGDCGKKDFALTAKAPNLMIVLDRSGSMGKSVPDIGKSRWAVASDAIAKMLVKYDGKIAFGLSLFSACGAQGCMPGKIDILIGAPVVMISSTIASTALCNSGKNETVIGGTLKALIGEPTLQAPDRDNVILLITDGQDNCGGGGAAAAKTLASQSVPVTTYVVGFSGDVNKSELTSIAQAAGTAPYFQADNGAQLDAALDAITASVATCTFTLDEVPPSSGLWVFFDKDPAGVAQGGNDGWTYDASTNSLTFHGAACDAIKQGKVTDIDVIYACTKPTPS